ncbi:non-ribosomal peptide synthetase [Tengunoibacter tsumagoiensis]|uniref:Carrier domain-containing protein n=1 Tax=Tengunoibacter tsumagoiensis TaxID=2014871 RepID=A0A402A9V7_9CHLR|nr:non-ribosomal peptide synthetase [Tengunoibacter tsumagoiensis]GCE15735.1 hypothetical protein KTT_55940 [Tengunoibacter tsumagoiensis]
MGEHGELFPLSHPQRRIWYIEELYPHTCIHSLGGFARINGLLDMKLLEKAIHAFIIRNAALSHQFTIVNGEPFQYINYDRPAPLRLHDFQRYKDPEASLQAYFQQELATPFELVEHPLYSFSLVIINDHTCGYIVKLHHIVTDGWSGNVMTDEISSLYEQFLIDPDFEVQPDYSYRQSIEDEERYLTSERFEKDQKFWLQIFGSLPETFLAPTSNDLSAIRKPFLIDVERTTALRELSQQKKWSINTIFVAALMISIHKLYQQEDVIIGIPTLNRRGAREKRIFGMFAGTMPFRKSISEEHSIAEIVASINTELMKCFFHQKYPYNLLIQNLDIGSERVNTLFQMSMNYYNTKFANTIAGCVIDNFEWFSGMQIYALQMVVKDWLGQGTLQGFIDYKQKDYTEAQIDRMIAWFLSFIDLVHSQSDTKIKDIATPLLEEKAVDTYSDQNASEYPRNQPIQHIFEEQVERTPSAVALIYEQQQMTYAELNRRSNQLAYMLRSRGVTRESVVGLLSGHTPELLISIWAIIKAGGAYLPIDPEYPLERIHYMLSNSGALLLLTDRDINLDASYTGEVIRLQSLDLQHLPDENLPTINEANDLVYIIYTSGSTGQPKGIMIEHQSLMNYIWWAKSLYLQTQTESVALYSPIAFDLTITSIFMPLINGNSIVIYPPDSTEFVLQRIIRDNRCAVIKATPAHLALIDAEPVADSCIRCFIVGGEDLRTNTAHALWQKFGGKIRIFNEYGPTETTVGCMIHEYNVEQDTGSSVPIGHAINNMQIYLLTEQLQPASEGMVAELFVSGDGVARGYLNRDDLTAERFLINPLNPEKRMYRTGDLARYQNGQVEYLGRTDDQVKIQGYRIELSEIESQLLKHTAVKQAVVLVKIAPTGQKYLVAFVQLHMPFPTLHLKRFLTQSLPTFMVPTLIIEQQQFPLSQNGKIDRSALAQLDREMIVQQEKRVDPALERALLDIVADILQTDHVSLQSNVYFLGADSVKAIQIASRLTALGYQVRARDILTYPVLQELALMLEEETAHERHEQPPCVGMTPSTPIMTWFQRQHFADPNYWHQSVCVELHARLTPQAIQNALQTLVHHHDALRLNYDAEQESFFYNASYLAEDLQVLDILDVPEDATPETLQSQYVAFKSRLNLQSGLLFRALFVRTAHRDDRLLLVAHHAIVDGISWRILLEDIQTLLMATQRGDYATLPTKTTSVQRWAWALQDYADRMNAAELQYWQQATTAWTMVPTDYEESEGMGSHRHQKSLSVTLSQEESLLLLTGSYAAQINEVLVASLAMTLAQLLHQDDITLELEAHGREDLFEDIAVSRTVGWFTSMFPLTLRVASTEPAIVLPAIQQQLHAVPHKGIGFGILAYGANRIEAPAAPGIRFNYLGEVDNGINQDLFHLHREETGLDRGPTNALTCGVEIIAMVYDKIVQVEFIYSSTKYKESTIQVLAESFCEQLKTMIAECCQSEASALLSDNAFPLSEEELSFLLTD